MPTNPFVYIRLVFCAAWSHSASATRNIIFFTVTSVGAASLVMPGFGMTVNASHLLAILSNPKFYAVLFGLIVILRIIFSPYWIWEKDQKAIFDLRAKLNDRKRRQWIKVALGELLENGRQLMMRCGDEDQEVPTAEADAWASKAETFFHENMDDSFKARFRDDSGLPMTANSIISMPHRNLWMGIWIRNSRLQEFIREYGN